jgi:2-polyprenyl-3-methyl-5-hydroxy-6-metoxy-1,4-benzoquinol methylase
MPLAFTNDEQHPMVAALLRTRVPRWEQLNRAIDERDDMLDFAMQLFERDRDAALTNYFQNGLEQFNVVKHVASWRPHPPRGMLDFASGYGRLTRFLVHQHLADEITVSDILEGGMEFQAREFGVQTILSAANPDDFAAPSKYDLVFVASLFTHLPPATFTRWLRRLAALLEPEGMLLFSVHDESIAPLKVEEGIAFETTSESRVLDTSEYGSTWVTESYVREQVASIDPGFACVRLPRALSDWQDMYVISPSPLDGAPRRSPKGFFERCEIVADGVRFAGWATSIDEEADRVEVRIEDDVVASTSEFRPRPDVGAFFNSDAATNSAWELIVPHDKIQSFRYQTATLSVFSRQHVERILFIGTIDSATGFAARERARAMEKELERAAVLINGLEERNAVLDHQRAELERLVAAMQQSRFWKARDQWFRLKGAIPFGGRTD